MFQIITFKNKSHKQPRQLLQLNFNMHRQLFIIILYRKIQHSLIQQTLLYTKHSFILQLKITAKISLVKIPAYKKKMPRRSSRINQVTRIEPKYPEHITEPSSSNKDYYGLFDDKEKLFECAICTGILWDTRILPYHHRFCRGCIERWIDTAFTQKCKKVREENAIRDANNEQLKFMPSITEISVKCPLCRMKFSPMQPNFCVDGNITSVMDMLTAKEKQINELKRKVEEEEQTSNDLRRQVDALESEIVLRARRAEDKNKRIKIFCENIINENNRI